MCMFNLNHPLLERFNFHHPMSTTKTTMTPKYSQQINYTLISSTPSSSVHRILGKAGSHALHRTDLWMQQAEEEKPITSDAVRLWQATLHRPWHRAGAMHSSLLLWRKPRHCSRASETRRTNAPVSGEASSWKRTSASAWNEAAFPPRCVKQSIPHQKSQARRDNLWKNEMPGSHLKGARCGILSVRRSISNYPFPTSTPFSCSSINNYALHSCLGALSDMGTAVLKPASDSVRSGLTY